MADVEFFFDPICPWAWIRSRWVDEVARQRSLDVQWRFIALRIVNEAKDYATDFPAGYPAVHGTGLKLLRVCAAVQDAEGPARMADLYTQFGADLHIHRRRSELVDHFEEGFPEYLRSVGIEERYIGAANDPTWDAVLRADTELALSRTGKDVGTPIISFTKDGVMQSFFGPVMSVVPRGPAAVTLWDAIWTVATFPGMAELKRSLRDAPQTASLTTSKASAPPHHPPVPPVLPAGDAVQRCGRW